jgi:hypothetical protein
MGLRSLEPERIGRLRAAHATRLTFAERILDYVAGFFNGMLKGTVDEEDRVLITRILLSFYRKIVADLWAIVVLSERGLPTSSLTRELLENVISVAYIASDHSTERARLCKSYLYTYNKKDIGARMFCHSGSMDEYQQNEEFLIYYLANGDSRIGAMWEWRTWAGCTIEEMAKQSALPDRLCTNLLAFLDSRAVQTFDGDWKDLVRAPDGKAIETNVPERVEWHLLLACAGALAALEIIGGNLGVDRQAELAVLHSEIETLWRSPG